MGLFTKENAAELGRKGGLTSRSTYIPPLKAKPNPLDTEEQSKRKRLAAQIDQIDEMLAGCKDRDAFIKLVGAKARLWELLYPKPGSLRPKQSRQERAPVSPLQPISEPIQPQPVVNQAPLVVSENEQSHKSEIIQS